MASKARRAGSLATILNANTAAASNTLVIDSGGDISLTGSLTVSSGVVGYITNTDLQATFAQNTAITSLNADYLQVANADALYVTKSTALTSNNALVNLINDRYQVANASVKFVTKSVQLTSNNSLVNLINDRIQVANVSTTLGTYWPSANVIAYTDTVVTGSTKSVNSSIYIASGGENRVAIPYTNTNHMLVYLNGIQLVEGSDYEAANNAHIGNITPVLAEGDVLLVEEFKNHSSNTTNRSAGGGGGGSPTHVQGSNYGYAVGGYCYYPGGINPINSFERWPFASDTNSSPVGSTPGTQLFGSGHSSPAAGYASQYATPTLSGNINKFPFSSPASITCVGTLQTCVCYGATQSSTSAGYTSGGRNKPAEVVINTIQKFPFSTESSASDVADLTEARWYSTPGNSGTHGYTLGGITNPGFPSVVNTIDKYPFASEGNASDVGDLVGPTAGASHSGIGTNSSTDGYYVGGSGGNICVQKYSFSSDGNAALISTCVLCNCGSQGAHQSGTQSETDGYKSGGSGTSSLTINLIERFPFASDSETSTDVGDLSSARAHHSAAQF